jgi:UDP-glucose 4-epimerase
MANCAGLPVAVVTGGAGFIGSHMVDLLISDGFHVRVVDNLVGGSLRNISMHIDSGRAEFYEVDIRLLQDHPGIFEDAEFVFHFAGIGDIVPSIEHPEEYMSVNVQGTVTVLQMARRSRRLKKFVYAASSSCFGLANTPTTEDHPIDTKYPYALSKYLGELACLHWGAVYQVPVNAVRIFNAYGIRSRTNGAYGAVFGVFLRQLIEGRPLTVVGDGEQSRDFVYVTDVARAFHIVANKAPSGEVYNLGNGNPQSVNRLVELLNPKGVEFIPDRPGEPRCTHADVTKLKSLGWASLVEFEQGVSEMLENIEYWKAAPLWDSRSIKEATKTWFKHMGKVD